MPPHRKFAALAGALALLLGFTVFAPTSTPGPLERDFEAYYAAGATVNAGGDPYSRAIWTAERRVPGVNASRDELLPFVGPAAALPLWSLLARLPYRGAVAIWTAFLVTAVFVVVGAALRLARAPRDPWLYGIATGMAVASAPTIGSLALGQAALISAAGVAGAAVAYRARRPREAFGATLLAAFQPNLALTLVARMRSGWDLRVAACAGGAFALLTLAVGGGVSGLLGYLQRLGAHGAAERTIAIQHTPAAVAYALGLPIDLAPVFGTIVACAAAVGAAAVIVRERLEATAATLVTGALLPLAVPFFHEQDFVLEVLPVLVLAVSAKGHARGLAAIAAVLVLVDWFGFAQRHGAQGQIVCLGLAVALGFIALGRPAARRWQGDLVGLAALAVVAAVAVPLGASHAAPTWPDTLPAYYRADSAADASAVWADESRVAGLTGRDPVWGLLRAIPLAGCVVLVAAIVTDARRRRTAREFTLAPRLRSRAYDPA